MHLLPDLLDLAAQLGRVNCAQSVRGGRGLPGSRGRHRPVSRESIHRTLLTWKRAKFEAWFLLNVYHFHTLIKSKSPKSHHHESGIIYLPNVFAAHYQSSHYISP